MKVVGSGLTNPGLKRKDNEDFHVVDPDLGLYLVCDGVGGNNAGEVASQTAAQTIHAILKDKRAVRDRYLADPSVKNRDALSHLIADAVQAACAKVYKMSLDDPSKKGMATTLAMALVTGSNAILAYVGDSRIYLNRQGKGHQLSEDHSFCAEQIRKGLMTPEQAKTSEYAHMITRAIGIYPTVDVDTLHLELMTGDTLVLCSDGLSDYFKGNEFVEIAKQHPFEKLPQALIQFALQSGGRDNVTVLAVQAQGETQQKAAGDVELNQKIETLKKIPLFRLLSYQELVKLLEIITTRNYAEGSEIITDGTSGDEMYVVLSGTVDILKGTRRLASLDKGSFFGEMELIHSSSRSATVKAATNVRVIVIARKDFYPLMRREQQLAVKLLWEFCQVLNSRLKATNELFMGSKSDIPRPPPGPVPFFVHGNDE